MKVWRPRNLPLSVQVMNADASQWMELARFWMAPDAIGFCREYLSAQPLRIMEGRKQLHYFDRAPLNVYGNAKEGPHG